jgi:DNA mismatch repair ATPase MutL
LLRDVLSDLARQGESDRVEIETNEILSTMAHQVLCANRQLTIAEMMLCCATWSALNVRSLQSWRPTWVQLDINATACFARALRAEYATVLAPCLRPSFMGPTASRKQAWL